MILDMTEYHNNLKRYLKERVKYMKFVPTLHIITDGKDKRCETYMKSKLNMCKEIRVPCVVDVVSSTYEISELLDNIENTNGVCICQLPIKKELEEFYKIDAEFRDIDVDGVFSGITDDKELLEKSEEQHKVIEKENAENLPDLHKKEKIVEAIKAKTHTMTPNEKKKIYGVSSRV